MTTSTRSGNYEAALRIMNVGGELKKHKSNPAPDLKPHLRDGLEEKLLAPDELLGPQGGEYPSFENNQLEHEPGDRWVAMTNSLARAGSDLTLAEKRLVMLAVSRIDSRQYVPDTIPMVRIHAEEYAQLYKLDMHTAYEALRDAAKALYDRNIIFFEPEHKRLKRNKVPKETHMRWVGQADYQRGEGWVDLHFWPKVVPHLMGLRKHFTTYQLQQAHALRSTYSWKLLELLSSFVNEGEGWMQISIEDFCTVMGATKKQQTDFAYIRRKIIEPAVKELREKDHWLIEWRPMGGGRKVRGLRFIFQRNTQTTIIH